MNQHPIKHFSFDLWLTLIQPNPYYKQKRNRLVIAYFNIDTTPELVDQVYSKYDRLFNTINEITGGNLDAYEMWLIFLDELGVDIRTVSPSVIEDFKQQTEQLFFENPPTLLDKNTLSVFKTLKDNGCTLSLLCNTAFTESSILKKLLIQLGASDYLDFLLFSDEMGYSKPNKKVFEHLFNQANALKPLLHKEILHLGDNPIADVKGANEFGIQSLWLPPNKGISDVLMPYLI